MKRLGIVALAAALAACSTWSPVAGTTKLGEIRVEANLPPDWMQMKATDEIVFTRDGVSLEYIKIRRRKPADAMPHTEGELTSGMLPHEVADLALDDIRLTEGVTNFELIENSPFRIDGRPCYRLLYSHRIDSGLKVKTVEFGCWTRRGLYRIEYRAAAQHYFDQYLDVFERFRQGIRFAS
jgi:hypothetical protein